MARFITTSNSVVHFPPQAHEIRIPDMILGLSRICRFNGHVDQHYSVAEHSVLVSYLVPREYALAGLLHDGAEAWIGDMNGIIKNMLREADPSCFYFELERQFDVLVNDIFSKLKSPDQQLGYFPCVKEADNAALIMELSRFRDGVGTLACWEPDEAYGAFVGRLNELLLPQNTLEDSHFNNRTHKYYVDQLEICRNVSPITKSLA